MTNVHHSDSHYCFEYSDRGEVHWSLRRRPLLRRSDSKYMRESLSRSRYDPRDGAKCRCKSQGQAEWYFASLFVQRIRRYLQCLEGLGHENDRRDTKRSFDIKTRSHPRVTSYSFLYRFFIFISFLLFFFQVTSALIIHQPPYSCLAIVVPDGYMNGCNMEDKISPISVHGLQIYKEALLVLYRHDDQRIINIMPLTISPPPPSTPPPSVLAQSTSTLDASVDIDATQHEPPTEKNVVNAQDMMSLAIKWPKRGSTLTNNEFEFSVEESGGGSLASRPSAVTVCAKVWPLGSKENVDLDQQSILRDDVPIQDNANANANANADTCIELKDDMTTSLIKTNLTNGEWCASLYTITMPSLVSDTVCFIVAGTKGGVETEVGREVGGGTSHVIDTSVKDSLSSANQTNDVNGDSKIRSNSYNNNNNNRNNNNENHNNSDSNNEVEDLGIIIQKGNNITRLNTFDNAVHIAVMSTRSIDRYEEAEVMIKSLLLNRDKARDLVIHMILDQGGKLHFHKVFSIIKFYATSAFTSTQSDPIFLSGGIAADNATVRVFLHNFEHVCVNPLQTFLSTIDMHESIHHSGKAGYCRLFMPTYFNHFFSDVYHSINTPQLIIAIETDQLFLGDVTELWDHILVNMDADDLVAAAENYQPWLDSSHFGVEGTTSHSHFVQTHAINQNRNSNAINASNNNNINDISKHDDNYNINYNDGKKNASCCVHHDGTYHGFGVIGGIMGFHLGKLRHIDWEYFIVEKFKQFRGSSRWNVRLNDQDVFNALFTLNPQHLYILPCQWNVQLHARLNSILTCYHHLFEGSSFYEEDMAKVTCTWFNKQSSDDAASDETDNLQCTQSNPNSGDLSLKLLNFFSVHHRRLDHIPFNCPASRRRDIFVCPERAKVLHFMAQGYQNYDFLQYYAGFWETHKSLSWQLAV